MTNKLYRKMQYESLLVQWRHFQKLRRRHRVMGVWLLRLYLRATCRPKKTSSQPSVHRKCHTSISKDKFKFGSCFVPSTVWVKWTPNITSYLCASSHVFFSNTYWKIFKGILYLSRNVNHQIKEDEMDESC